MIDNKSKNRLIANKLKLLQRIKGIKTGLSDINDRTSSAIDNSTMFLSSFTRNLKKKNTTSVFDKLIQDFNEFLPKDYINNESLLRRISFECVDETLKTLPTILKENLTKFSNIGDGVIGCGIERINDKNNIIINPTEFDLLNVLKSEPDTILGQVFYEKQINSGKIKMNREFHNLFIEGDFNFLTTQNNILFSLNWNQNAQNFLVTNISNINYINFIADYLDNIELPNIDDFLKSLLNLVSPVINDSNNQTIDLSILQLDNVLKRVISACKNPINDDLLKLEDIEEGEDSIDDYFVFDIIENEDFNKRINNVIKFVDCDNYDLPINQLINEDFLFKTQFKTNLISDFNDTITNIAKEATINNKKIPFIQFLNSLDLELIKNIPNVLGSLIFSPKIIFPFVLVNKFLKDEILTIKDFITKYKNIFINIIRKLFEKFITLFWSKIKLIILRVIKENTLDIITNSKRKYIFIIKSIISLLKRLRNTNDIRNCGEIYDDLLSLINGFRVGGNQRISGVLLQLTKILPGYSENRAILNIVEYLESNGIPTGDLYGEENNIILFVSSLIKGHQQEMNENSFVQVSLDGGTIPVAPLGGAAQIIPGILKAHGKLV